MASYFSRRNVYTFFSFFFFVFCYFLHVFFFFFSFFSEVIIFFIKFSPKVKFYVNMKLKFCYRVVTNFSQNGFDEKSICGERTALHILVSIIASCLQPDIWGESSNLVTSQCKKYKMEFQENCTGQGRGFTLFYQEQD